MWGARERIHLYIGPRSRDNEVTSPIQRVTRGEVGQRSDVVHPANDTWWNCWKKQSTQQCLRSDARQSEVDAWHFFGRRNEHSRSTNDFTTSGSRRPLWMSCKLRLYPGRPFEQKGQLIGYREICFISNSSIGIVQDQDSEQCQELLLRKLTKFPWTRIWYTIDEVLLGRQ